MQDIKKRLAKGAVWLTATRAVVNLAAFANTLLLARLLEPADFGLVALATTVAAVISSVTELSLASALIQQKDPLEEHFHSAWTLNFVRSCLIALVIAVLAIPLAHLYHDDRLVLIMCIIAVTTLLSGLLNPKLAIFSRDLIFWQEFALSTSQKVAGLIAGTFVALEYRSYWALVANLVATQVTAISVSYLLKPYRPRLRLKLVGDLLSFSIWLTLAQVANTLNYKFDQLIIGYFLGSSSLGYYNVGDNLAVLPTREATTPLAQTLFPGFVRMSNDLARLRHAYQRAQAFLCAVALPVGFMFALIARPLIQLTIGPRWLPAVFIIQFLSGVFALQTLSSSLQPVAMALGKTRSLFGRDMLNLMVRLPLVVIGLELDGMRGIVYARCISGLISTFVNMRLVDKLLDLSIRAQLGANWRALFSVFTMTIVMLSVGNELTMGSAAADLISQIVILIFVGATVYIGIMFWLWRLTGCPPGPESEAIALLKRFRQMSARKPG